MHGPLNVKQKIKIDTKFFNSETWCKSQQVLLIINVPTVTFWKKIFFLHKSM